MQPENIRPEDVLTPREYQSVQAPETYQGTTDNFWDSVGNEIKNEGYGIAGSLYNAGAWVGTKIGASDYFKDDEGGFNFSDRMQSNQLELKYSHPNPIVADITSAATTLASIAVPVAGEFTLTKLGLEIPSAFGLLAAAEDGAESGAVRGIARRLGAYQTITTPFTVGDNVYYDSKGHASLDTGKFFSQSGVNLAMFGAFEGAGAAYRRITLTKGGEQATAANELASLTPEKPESEEAVAPFKTDTLDTVRPESQPAPLPEKSQQAKSVKELIESSLTEKQKRQILSDVTNTTLEDKELETDLRLTDEGVIDYNRYVTPAITGTARRKLIQAILSKHGVLLKGEKKHMDDALAVADVSSIAKNMRTYWKMSGVRKVLLTSEYEKARAQVKNTATLDRLDRELFTTMEYRNQGSLKNPNARDEFLSQSARAHESPLWYRQLKSGEENTKAQIELKAMASKGSRPAKLLQGLLEESNLKKHDGYRMHLLDSLDDVIENHLPPEEADRILEDARNQEGIFSTSALDEEIENMTKGLLEQKGVRFLDENPQNVFFTKTIKKLQDNVKAAEAYVSCLLGA